MFSAVRIAIIDEIPGQPQIGSQSSPMGRRTAEAHQSRFDVCHLERSVGFGREVPFSHSVTGGVLDFNLPNLNSPQVTGGINPERTDVLHRDRYIVLVPLAIMSRLERNGSRGVKRIVVENLSVAFGIGFHP